MTPPHALSHSARHRRPSQCTLGRSELTLVGPLANAMTVVFTGLTAAVALGERRALAPRALAGAALVCAGVALCVAAKLHDK